MRHASMQKSPHLRLLQPEAHVHVAVHRRRRGTVLSGLSLETWGRAWVLVTPRSASKRTTAPWIRLYEQPDITAINKKLYAELVRLRDLVRADGPIPLLFLLDEILHGANSHDRRLGAAAVVHGLLQRRAIGLVTTHDLALSEVADDPGIHAVNVHFEDRLEEGRMVFDYRMRPGVVRTSNALALMRALGLLNDKPSA